MSLCDDIQTYINRDLYPFHMPGHKRNPVFDSMNGLFDRDLTEVDGVDDLHCPQGILLQAQQRAAALYGADEAYFLVNGSTAGLLTSVSAALPAGSKIIVARNCHKAVYNAVFLRNLTPVYIYPDFDETFGINGSISPQSVQTALDANPDTKAIIITSPTYDGVCSDISVIAAIAHAHGIPLVVDGAHGAHHGFYDSFPKSALQLGADAVVVSLHKTLPSPTGTALLLTRGDRIKKAAVRRYLDVYETSSPSYLFMAAMDKCIEVVQTQRDSLFASLDEKLNAFSDASKDLCRLRILCMGQDRVEKHSAVFAHDKSRIVVNTENLQINGFDLEKILREHYKIEAEMSFGNCTVLLTSICDTQQGFDRLINALSEIDKAGFAEEQKKTYIECPKPQTVLLPWEAELQDSKMLPIEKAEGNICREYVCAYPPGTPVLIPGERITQQALSYIELALQDGAKITGSSGQMPQQIDVCKDC